ncbi:MAG: TRAP transporter substrate-binding protein [Marinagarivorans sp.]|nr:TRAP transporter substrate-binding protein [Marinagarivorans sp.]
MHFKKIIYLSITTLLIGVLAGCDTKSDVQVLKFAHGLDVKHPVHLAIAYMAECLNEKSKGTLKMDIYPAGQLGGEREMIELLQIGSLAMTKVSSSPLEGFIDEMKIFSVPYLFKDNEHFWRALNGDIGKRILLSGEPVFLRGLGFYDAGSRSFYSVKKPIKTPSDLAGMKIRVQNSQSAIEMVNSIGGSATPIAWGELYTALQSGVVDGAENNPPSFLSSKHYEVAKYFTLDEHTMVPDLVLIGKYTWDHLTPEQRIWVQEAMDESIVYQRKLWGQATIESLEAVKAAGVEVIYPDKILFQNKAAAPALSKTNAELVQQIESLRE